MAVVLSWLALPLQAPAQAQVAPGPVVDMATVQVSGEQPGPGLWKVTSPQGHHLWVLGTVSPVPAGVEWRSDQVQEVIAVADHVLGEPGVTLDTKIGLLRGLTLLPLARKTTRDPQGRTLQEIVSAPTYARWQVLKKQYLGRDSGVEKARPLIASGELYMAFLKRSGLRDSKAVDKALARAYKARGLEPEDTRVKLKVDDVRATLKELQRAEVDDRPCFERTLDTVEYLAPVLRERADAWALGDIAALRRLSGSAAAKTCMGMLFDSAFARQRGWSDLPRQTRQQWLTQAEAAMAAHANTFAPLPMYYVLGEESLLDALAQRGYTVEAPPE